MKVILLGPAHPYRGGLASFNERLAQQFMVDGNETEILTFKLQYPGIFFPGKTQFTENKAPAGIIITRILNSVNPLNWIKTGCMIRKKNPDILLIKYWHPFMAPCLGTTARIAKMGRRRFTKVICIFDNVVPHEKRLVDRFLSNYFIGSIDAAVVMSKSVLEDLNTFNVKIPVVFSPHPLYDNYGAILLREEALKRLNLPEDFSYLLFFGFIRAYKGLDLLFNAFADKRLRGRKLKLIVAGEFYEDEAPYKDLIEKLAIKNDVILCDRFIGEDEVGAFFSVADLIVQPYKSATQSGVTQIAYHFDKPMLVTDVGGLSEIVPDGKCGYVVKTEPKAIADAILDFFDNKRSQEFIQNVRKEKEKFTWNKMTAAISEVNNKK
jgi:D-inositol-3-phosphate glycosyltransferase